MTSSTDNDSSFTRKAMQTELLDAETELQLARAWRDNQDQKSLDRLITAYMRLAISMAAKYRRYGASMNDLIQEAGLGLMKAADKFDPERGVRFSTYAVWWIRASIQDYVMRNWSLVRTGSTSSQKALFFNMRRVRTRLERDRISSGDAVDRHEINSLIAAEIGVPLRDVEMMEGRLSGSDYSLNAPQTIDNDGREWVESLAAEDMQADELFEQVHDQEQLREWLTIAMNGLSERERLIVNERRLSDSPRTLQSLGNQLGVSKERVRQLEAAALGKMRRSLESQSPEIHRLVC